MGETYRQGFRLSSLTPHKENKQFAKNQLFLFEPHRYKVAYGGRGGTKSWGFARALLAQGADKPLRILCAREVQKSIKDSVHTLLSDQIQLLDLGGFYEVLTNEIRGRNGTRFIFTGLSNLTAESIKSYEGVDRVWVEEAAAVTRRSWDILIPTIRKDGSEIWISFNPELDTDETWVRFIENTPKNAYVQEMSYDTNWWFPDVLEDERQEFLRAVESGARKQSDYDNIWGGKCKPAVDGAIYPDEVAAVMKSGRLCNVPHNPEFKTHTIWDLGWNDSMVILFVQIGGGSVNIIDCIIDSHRTYDSYVAEIKDRGYTNMAKAWLPHDGKMKNAQTGKSPIELLNKMGLNADTNGVPNIGVQEGIEAARQMFPRCYFDKTKCTPLFNQLRRYARVISPTTEEPGGPKHDENSHGADAFRYLAVIEKELKNNDQNFKPLNHDYRGIV